jgi:phosphonate transport system substrate-binding protein
MRKKSAILALLLLFLAACAPKPQAPIAGSVHLNDLVPLPTPVNREIKPFRVAVAAVISPQGTTVSYQPLIAYLENRLGRPVEIVQRRSYAEINALISKGEVDLAFVCTSSYLVGEQDGYMELVAMPQVAGQTTYQSYLIVPADSPAKRLEDLRGKVFAFTDPLSFSGRVLPVYWLEQIGETPESFFRRTFFTYSHDDAIHAVAEGIADGAAVDSLVFDFALQRDPSLKDKVRVIYRSPAYGIPPVVTGKHIRPQTRHILMEILTGMAATPDGQQALQALGYDRFVEPEPRLYDSAFEVMRHVQISLDSEE